MDSQPLAEESFQKNQIPTQLQPSSPLMPVKAVRSATPQVHENICIENTVRDTFSWLFCLPYPPHSPDHLRDAGSAWAGYWISLC